MRKTLFAAAIAFLIVALTSCSSISGTTSSQPKILRSTDLAGKYEMYQLEITLNAGEQVPIILQLAAGDSVDGYYYLESGDSHIAFQITNAGSTVYTSNLKNLDAGKTISDRFSFTAPAEAGYTLTLSNTSDTTAKTKSTVFMELIYPGSTQLFSPLNK